MRMQTPEFLHHHDPGLGLYRILLPVGRTRELVCVSMGPAGWHGKAGWPSCGESVRSTLLAMSGFDMTGVIVHFSRTVSCAKYRWSRNNGRISRAKRNLGHRFSFS